MKSLREPEVAASQTCMVDPRWPKFWVRGCRARVGETSPTLTAIGTPYSERMVDRPRREMLPSLLPVGGTWI